MLQQASAPAEHELITIAEFASRVHRSPVTIRGRIHKRQMPEGTVFQGMGQKLIDWTAWIAYVRSRKIV